MPKKKLPAKGSAKQFVGILTVVAIIGVAAIAWALSRPKAKAVAIDPGAPLGPAVPHVMGRPDAPVRVIEFGDFECPTCGQFATVTEPDVRKNLVNTGIVVFEFYDLPIRMHRNTLPAHIAASCAEAQGKFWEMHDRLYAGQLEWNGEATTTPKKLFLKYVSDIGIDVKAWERCFDAQEPLARIQASAAEARRLKVPGTPYFYVGNRESGPLRYDQLKRMVDEALAAVKAESGVKRKAPPGA